MKDTIDAITQQQLRIAYENKDCNNMEQHLKDLNIIFDLTMIKIALKNNRIKL